MKTFIRGGVQEVVLRVLASNVHQPVLRDDAPTGRMWVAGGTALVARLILCAAACGVVVYAGVFWTEKKYYRTSDG